LSILISAATDCESLIACDSASLSQKLREVDGVSVCSDFIPSGGSNRLHTR